MFPGTSVEYKAQQYLVCARLSEEIEALCVCEEHMEGVGIKAFVSSPGLGFPGKSVLCGWAVLV